MTAAGSTRDGGGVRIAEGLGWPEGPAVLPDGSVVFVETYRGRVSRWTHDGGVVEHAFVGGGPIMAKVAPSSAR